MKPSATSNNILNKLSLPFKKVGKFLKPWKYLTKGQWISLFSILFFLAALPVGVYIVLNPKGTLFSRAFLPITPPTPPFPFTPSPYPTHYPTPVPTYKPSPTPTKWPTPTPKPTYTPLPSPPPWSPSPTPSPFPHTPIPTVIPGPTVIPTPGPNQPPEIIGRFLRTGVAGRKYRSAVRSIDEDGDYLEMVVRNLPRGLDLEDCKFSGSFGKTSRLNCWISGVPHRSGFYLPVVIVRDDRGLISAKRMVLFIRPNFGRR
jgi:hypothetical protein